MLSSELQNAWSLGFFKLEMQLCQLDAAHSTYTFQQNNWGKISAKNKIVCVKIKLADNLCTCVACNLSSA